MTHGDIMLRTIGKRDRFWLHTYHTGHRDEAYENLVTLPEWLVQRALLEHWRSSEYAKGDEERKQQMKAVGSLGPWQLTNVVSVKEHLPPKKLDVQLIEQRFERDWKCFLGVNLDYCDAATVGSWMIQRHFNRWQMIREANIPYHKVGRPADINVVCDPKNQRYTVYPSEEHSEMPKRVVEFGDDLYEAFKREAVRILTA